MKLLDHLFRREHLLAFTLLTGLLTLTSAHALRALDASRLLSDTKETPVVLEISAATSDKSLHDFLQSLLAMQEVASLTYTTKEQRYAALERSPVSTNALGVGGPNPFLDELKIVLRNPSDFTALFAALQTPKFASLLSGEFLWQLPDTYEASFARIADARRTFMRFSFFGLLSLGLALLVLFQFIRTQIRSHAEDMRMTALLGADLRVLYSPVLLEGGMFFSLALLLSLVLVFLF